MNNISGPIPPAWKLPDGGYEAGVRHPVPSPLSAASPCQHTHLPPLLPACPPSRRPHHALPGRQPADWAAERGLGAARQLHVCAAAGHQPERLGARRLAPARRSPGHQPVWQPPQRHHPAGPHATQRPADPGPVGQPADGAPAARHAVQHVARVCGAQRGGQQPVGCACGLREGRRGTCSGSSGATAAPAGVLLPGGGRWRREQHPRSSAGLLCTIIGWAALRCSAGPLPSWPAMTTSNLAIQPGNEGLCGEVGPRGAGPGRAAAGGMRMRPPFQLPRPLNRHS